MECVACRGALAPFGPRRGYTCFICRRCASVQLWPIPDASTLERHYAEHYVEAGSIAEFAAPDVWRHAGEPYGLRFSARFRPTASWHTALISPAGLHAMAERTGWIVQSVRPSALGRTRGGVGVAQRAAAAAVALSAGTLATTHVCVLRRK